MNMCDDRSLVIERANNRQFCRISLTKMSARYIHLRLSVVKSKFVCKLPSGITVDNYAARRAACSSAIRCS